MSFRTNPESTILLRLQLFPDAADPDKSPTLGPYGISSIFTARKKRKLKHALEDFLKDLSRVRDAKEIPNKFGINAENFEIDEKTNLYWKVPVEIAYLLRDLLVRRGGVPANRVQVAESFELDAEISDSPESVNYFEERQKAYLTAIRRVKYEGLTPLEALTRMWNENPSWQDEPLEVVLVRLLGVSADKDTSEKVIYQAQRDFGKLALIKKHLATTPIKNKPSLEFDFEEVEEVEEPEEIEGEEEPEETEEDNEEWLTQVKQQEPVVYKKKQLPGKMLPTPIYPQTSFPKPPSSRFQYQIWVFNGKNFVPLTLNEEWVGSDSVEEAKNLASTYGGRVWPRALVTKNFNIWVVDKESGKIVPLIYDYQGTLIHLGQDSPEKADKMLRILAKDNTQALVVPKEQKLLHGQNLFYYINRRKR